MNKIYKILKFSGLSFAFTLISVLIFGLILVCINASTSSASDQTNDQQVWPQPPKRESNDQIRIDDMVLDQEGFVEPERINLTIGSLLNDQVNPMGATHYFFGNPWTNGVLPIEFAPGIFEKNKNLFWEACREWENLANIKCKARNKESQYVRVQSTASGCWAEIGMGNWYSIGGRERTINLENGCWSKHIIMHEIGHTLSFLHEHQRADRNDYLKINWSNVPFSFAMNFIRLALSTQLTDYDFESIMHYPSYAFTPDRSNLESMIPQAKFEKYHYIMGRIQTLSSGDGKAARALYGDPLR